MPLDNLKCRLVALLAVLPISLFSQNKIYFESDSRPIVEVVVNGVRTSMLVDTGSSLNIIDVNQLTNLGIKKRFKMSSANAVFGKTTMWQLLECDVRFQGINVYQFAATDIEMVVHSIEHNTGIKIAGILGTPAIKELKMIIDLSRGIVTINKKNGNTALTD